MVCRMATLGRSFNKLWAAVIASNLGDAVMGVAVPLGGSGGSALGAVDKAVAAHRGKGQSVALNLSAELVLDDGHHQ